ncbi:MAG: arsenosugar biosynthesis radical SAM protein ArsS [Magnetococcales bacterium]|nr:arsenosugar biosynthesis radical SAM protein ArsS [Magnetococcales bacterium]
MIDFMREVEQHTDSPILRAETLSTIQVNVGLRCNLECRHCHLGSSPRRQEEMDWSTMEKIVDLVESTGCQMVDLTGGAPELNPHLKRFIRALRARDVQVQVRTNLTILLEPKLVGMAAFFRDHQVGLVASMPCYLEENVDSQRGMGTFAESVAAIQLLNRMGYGVEESLPLNLVYNPGGPSLPPPQSKLEEDYKRALKQRYDIAFSSLHTITNIPIGRFRADLRRDGREDDYWMLLHQSFNPATLGGLMCRNQISIGWDGTLYDCDFNLALNLPIQSGDQTCLDLCDPLQLGTRPVVTGNHCFACTSGNGSSCGGALVE